ncbi:MIP/aquaporin family protein [Fundicoccus culcitae]|uniref:Aquaporin n=1 Tax=Fundicoccus culcitae TaxID=2969821 RepID=A0ABY5P453_9LACT|nr:aquaporin [Fundicoccus culcitae]UUX33512.1 aquaporin [Fundicoccus culcitae]
MNKKFIAELTGTYFLVLIGTGTAVFSDNLIAIALAFGLVVTVLIFSFGNISGAHFNPSVTLAMFLNHRIHTADLIHYLLAQFIGATLATATLALILASNQLGTTSLGVTVLGPGVSILGGFLLEFIMTFFFVMIILIASGKNGQPQFAGLIIGLALITLILFGASLTGTSLNPARSFGPAIWTGGLALNQLWLYILAPMLGGAAAAIVCRKLFDTEKI